MVDTIRIQAEQALRGHTSGTTDPAIVTFSGLPEGHQDRPNADAADGDAYVDIGAASGQFIEFTVNVAEAGFYDIDLGYALSSGSASTYRPMRLDVNGALFDRMFNLPPTGADFATYGEQTTRVALQAGDNTIRFLTNGFDGPNIDYLDVRPADANLWTFQGETLVTGTTLTTPTSANRAITAQFLADKNNASTSKEIFRIGAEGEAYLDWGQGTGVDFTFTAPTAGTYSIAVTYASATARPLGLSTVKDGVASPLDSLAIAKTAGIPKLPSDVGDLPAGTVLPASTDLPQGWEGWTTETITVTLPAGVTTLRLAVATPTSQGPNVDKIQVALVDSTPISLGGSTVAENAPGAAIGQLALSDLDGDAYAFAVSDPRFAVTPEGVLKLAEGVALDYETATAIPLDVTATGPNGQTITQSFSIAVTNDASDDATPNTAPTGLALTGSVAENAAGALVGTLSASDAEKDALTYSTNDARFVVVGAELRLANGVSLNHETDNGSKVVVTVSDGKASSTGELVLNVSDVNDAPTLSGTQNAVSVTAGQGFELAAGVVAADEDAGDTAAISARLAGGGALPTGVSFSGRSFTTAADTAPGDYVIEIFANDGELNSAAKTFTLTVAAPQPTPIFKPFAVQAESGTLTLTDTTPDAGDTTVRDASNPESGSFSGLRPNYSGTGYVDFGDTAGDKTTYTVKVPVAGTYDLTVRYASIGARPLDLSLNGGAPTSVNFPGTEIAASGGDVAVNGFDNWQYVTRTVTLQAGDNTVALAIPAGRTNGPNIDRIEINTAGAGPIDSSADADANLALAGPSSVQSSSASAVAFTVGGRDADVVKTEVSLDGGATRTAVTPDLNGTFNLDLSSRPAGDTTVRLFVTDDDGNTSDVRKVVTITTTPAGPFTPVIAQAESARLTLVDVDTNTNDTVVRDASNPESGGSFSGLRPGYTGTGYLDFGDTPGDTATFTIEVPTAGTYDLNIRYASEGARPLDVKLNNGAATLTDFPTTETTASPDGFNNWGYVTRTVSLAAGTNTVSLAIPAGRAAGPNIDRIEVTPAGTGPVDETADADGNLALSGPSNAATGSKAVAFAVAGRDSDIVKTEVSFDGGTTRTTVTPDASGAFTLDLSGRPAGTTTVSVIVTDDAGNEATANKAVTISDAGPQPFNQLIQAEAFTIVDTTTATAFQTTQVRNAANPEGSVARDANSDGLWDGWTGTGYLDMGGDVGDAARFTVNAPAAGTYTLTFRYANGGGEPNGPRPMAVTVDGVSSGSVQFAGTGAGGWDNWQEVSVEVQLDAGANVISVANTIANGPNLDSVTITNNVERPTEPGPREVIAINFQDGTAPKAAGYLVDNFQGFGARGNGYSYGWVTEASATDADGTTATPIDGAAYPTIAINERAGGAFDTYDARLTGYAHFDLGGYPARAAWQLALPNGWYEVTVSVGDTGGPNDSINRLMVEGVQASYFTPTDTYKTELVTVAVQVTDGFLTLAAPQGTITEMQYLQVRSLPDLTPGDTRPATADYAKFDQPRAVASDGATTTQVDLTTGDGTPAVGVDPTSDIFLGVLAVQGRGGLLLESLQDGSIKLYETLTGQQVSFSANTTAGFDSLTISPSSDLKPFTSYTLVIDGAQDRGSNTDSAALTREFQKFSTSFTTGAAPVAAEREVAFRETVEINGAADGAYGLSTVEISPDGKFLYAASLGGEIKRWVIEPDGSLGAEQVLAHPHFAGNAAGPRGIIGFTFDPTNPNVVWVSDNYAVPLEGRDNNVPDFSGRIVKLTLGTGTEFTATAETYITGLPRSNGDHLSNSLEFRVNPDAGQPGQPSHLLYLVQGSNSAMGAPDTAWGNRGERLLSAAVLEIDPTRAAPAGGFNVQTEPTPTGNTTNGASIFNADGTVTGWYNPYASDAVVKLFANGTRNAYDLVWHSNGYLYVPTNGSAAGGNTPDDPRTPVNEALNNASLQRDYLFRVEEGGYYGHPNPLRGDYVLNGGNPTSGTDPNEVTPTDGRSGYQVGINPDDNYRVESAYSLGFNRSPNGVTEYTSNIFGGSLKSALLFTEYSGGNDIRAVLLDANGLPREDFVLRNTSGQVIQYIDPLDIIENPRTGQLYLLTLNRSNGESQIVRLDPAPGGAVEPPPPTDGRVSMFIIQAEDNTPLDSTSVTVPGVEDGAQIVVRTMSNPEPNPERPALVNGLRPGAYGLDGNTVDNDGLTGGYADFGSTNADKITFTVNVTEAQAGDVVLAFRYANGDTAPRPLSLTVNGQVISTPSFAPSTQTDSDARWADWKVVEVRATLTAGQNTITLQSTANTGPNVDQLEIFKLTPTTDPAGTKYEAESAQLTPGAVVDTLHAGYSGSGFVDYTTTTADPDPKITWTVTVAEAGAYQVQIRHSNRTEAGPRPLELEVNGVSEGALPFNPTGAANTDYGFQSATVTLKAGSNTIALTAPGGVGSNIDYLLVPSSPSAPPFTPNYVQIGQAGGRIELEATDSSARVLDQRTSDFFFKVGADGLYALDFAANVDADDGGSLKVFLNGVEVALADFPGSAEETVYVELKAGVNYQLRASSALSGADMLDYLDVRPAPGNANADISVQSMDPAFLANRLHFSFIEDPEAVNPGAPRDFKDSGTVVISNTGTEALTFTDVELTGPFKLADPAQFTNLSLAPGQSIQVTVLFDRAAYTPPTTNVDATSTIFAGGLKLVTNDAENPITKIDLAGFWQARDEGGQEPNVNEIWKIFGFGNVIEGLRTTGGGENSTLSTNDVFAKTDETEVLSPYWRLAEGVTSAKITQLGAFHGPGGATFHIHNPGNKGSNVLLWNHEGTDNQRLLPNAGNDTTFATSTITNGLIPDAWVGNEVFGISVAGLSTDPRLNPRGDVLVEGAQQGHTVKMFQALDANGKVIPNVYLGIMDYTGINYDYNDNIFVIEGIEPVGFGQDLRVAGLDDAAADDRLVFTNIDTPASTSQAFRNEATFTIANDGFVPLNISSVTTGNPAFQIVGTVPTSIAAGGSAQITVRFVGDHTGTTAGAQIYKSTLTINSNDFNEGVKVIQLAGLAQEFSERGSEPTVAQIVEAFGYSTNVAQSQLNGGGAVQTIGDEVLLPYLEKLDPTKPVEVIQIAAFLQQGNVARLGSHSLSSSQVTNLFANDDQQGQTVLPDGLVAGAGSTPNVARGVINQNDPFGIYISVDGRPTYSSWSDPEANEIDPNIGSIVGDNQGHLIRYFKALDADGNVIPGTYIAIQDYAGASNYDYNDHMFVIKNVKAHELTAAQDANNNDINDALELDSDNDGVVNFFDTGSTPPPPPATQGPFGGTAPVIGSAAVTIDATRFDVGGQNVAYNDTTGADLGGALGRNEGVDIVGDNQAVGWIANGEWIEYTVNVTEAGSYTLVFNAASPEAGRSVVATFAKDGVVYATAANAAVMDTNDYTSFAPTTPVTVDLQAGVQVVRLNLNGGSFDLDSFTLDKVETQPPPTGQAPFGGAAPVVGSTDAAVTIAAARFDTGGQNVAYFDSTPDQDFGGTAGRNEGVDVGGDNDNIGWISNGEWVEYTITVAQAGEYTLVFDTASPDPGDSIVASFAQNGTVYATAPAAGVPDTDSWEVYAPTQAVTVSLREGTQVVRLQMNGDSFNVKSFTLDRVAAPPPPPPPAQTPFGGTAVVIGSAAVTLDATRFDLGGQNVAYNDTTAADLGGTLGRNEGVDIVGDNEAIGWVANGEWVEYTVNVTEAGAYTLVFNAASPEAGRSVVATFAKDGVVYETAEPAAVADTDSYRAFQPTQAVTVDLQAGVQVIRLNLNGGAFDLDSFTLDKVETQPPPTGQTPFGGAAPVVGSTEEAVTIDAARFDTGGQNVAYFDSTPDQDFGGPAGRNEGVDVGGDNANIGWISNGEWVEYTINVAQAGEYTLVFNTASPDPGDSIVASFAQNGAVYATAPAASVPDTDSWDVYANTQAVKVTLKEGQQVVRLQFNGDAFNVKSFTLDRTETAPPPPPPVQTPFGGTAVVIGSAAVTLDATRFDLGGQNVAYNDTTAADLGGPQGRNEGVDIVGDNQAVGWIQNGEWLEYTVNVTEAGAYTLVFNAASPDAGRSVVASFAKDGVVYQTAAAANVPDTNSYQAFQPTQAVTVDLQAGVQVIRLNLNGGAFDLDSFTLDKVETQPPPTGQAPFGGAAPVIGATEDAVNIKAARFDTGGQNVAYFDSTPDQDFGGPAGRNEGVDVGGDNDTIGWVTNGEWVEYTVNVARAGAYTLTFNTASPDPGDSIVASFAQNGTVYATAPAASVPDTDSWGAYATTQAVTVNLKEGQQVIRLQFNGEGFNLESFTLDRTEIAPPPPAQTPWGDTAPVLGANSDAAVIRAAFFDRGGQGVAFSDKTAEDSGGPLGRNEAVDIVADNQAIGWIEPGEWVEYTVRVAKAGSYSLTFNAGSGQGDQPIVASFAQNGAVYAVAPTAYTTDSTDWVYRNSQPVMVALKEGEQVIRLSFGGDYINLASFAVDLVETSSGASTSSSPALQMNQPLKIGGAEGSSPLLSDSPEWAAFLSEYLNEEQADAGLSSGSGGWLM